MYRKMIIKISLIVTPMKKYIYRKIIIKNLQQNIIIKIDKKTSIYKKTNKFD